MINSSLAEYVFIRFCILFLQAIGPLGLLFLCASLVAASHEQCWHYWPQIPTVAQILLSIEGVWFLIFALYRERLQRDAVHPRLRSKEDRRQLVSRVIDNTEPSLAQRHIRYWFNGAAFEDIGRDGVKRWLSWAVFEGRNGEHDRDEIEIYTTELERLVGKSFTPGTGNAEPLCLTLDRIEMSHRSLSWYFIVGIVDSLVSLRLYAIGYSFFRLPHGSLTLFPVRPMTLTSTKRSPAKHITYWHRPHTSRTRLPIVFVHGIGIGLFPYCDFLKEVEAFATSSTDDEVGIIALELMPISFRLTHSMLSQKDMCREILQILDHHGFDQFVLVAHSYGSVITTHILHDKALQPRVASILLVDPVTFLLHTPDVAYNFTRRKPRHANEWQLWYFASQDPGVAHTLGRHFFWADNVLWLEDLMPLIEKGLRVTVSLADRDTIVWTEMVGRYLADAMASSCTDSRLIEGPDEVSTGRAKSDDWRRMKWQGRGLEILWFDDTDHAQVFETKEKRARLLEVITTYCTVDSAQ